MRFLQVPTLPSLSALVFLGYFLVFECASQTLDQSFKVSVAQPGQIRAMGQQTDGKIVVLGTFDQVAGLPRDGIARLNADGSPDPTFQPPAGLVEATRTIFVQSDGRVVLGGSFPTGRTDPLSGYEVREPFVRLLADGTLDPTFHPRLQTGPSGTVAALFADQGNDSFALVYYDSFHGGVMNVSRDLVRLKADTGDFDHLTPIYDGDPFAAARLSDGSVVIGGDFNTMLGANRHSLVSRPYLARVSATGVLDESFQPRIVGLYPYIVSAVAVTPDNRIVIGGQFTTVNEQPRPGIARLYSAGGVDLSFNPTAAVGSGIRVTALLALSDGRVLVAGVFYDVQAYRLVRLNVDGSLDTTWKFPKTYGAQFNVLGETAGGVLIGGDLNFNRGSGAALLRTDANGSVDNSFAARLERPGGVRSVALQSDNKIVIGGKFSSVNKQPRRNLARLLPNGLLDTTFTNLPVNGGVSVVRALPDDKLLVGGSFPGIGVSQRRGLARLLPNGAVDNSFFPPLAIDSEVYDLAPGPNGRVVVCGNVTTTGTPVYHQLIRFETNAAVDTSFRRPPLAAPGFFDATIKSVDVQPDGYVLIGGNFNLVNGMNRQGVARLQINGNLDPTFDAGAFGDRFLVAPSVMGVRTGPAGRVFVCGAFDSVRDQVRPSFAAFDTTGVLLENFAEDFRSISANTLSVSAAGMVAVGEGFGDRFQVFANDGRRWFGGASLPGAVQATAVQLGGEVIVAGDFLLADIGAGLVRYLPRTDAPPHIISQPTPLTVEVGQSARFSVVAESSSPLTFQWLKDDVELAGQNGSSLELPEVTRAQAGRYRVLVRNTNETSSNEASLVVLGGVELGWGTTATPGTLRLIGRTPDGERFTPAELEQYAVEASQNLQAWQTLSGNLQLEPDGTAAYSDSVVAGSSPQFFRTKRR
ncbi:MAG TPA: immunoglobulin domain-containing protein [Verrucomicrobiota bacterium]|nr:hypothetical protein [Verrucomicrobiales bacterium]HRI13182.1 immunoglobulin domain-containing protein [Verrucomicrobiota bacterium]